MNQVIIDKLEKFFADYTQKTYNAGQVIILADQEPEGILYLEQGTVEQYDINQDGVKVTVNIYRSPAFFPMSWAINDTPNEYFYEASSQVKLRVADPKKTLAFVKSNPEIMFDLMSRVYKGTDALLRRLALAGTGVARERLMYELLIESYRFGAQTGDGQFVINVKQNALAARSGLARETVSRELHKLEQLGFITMSKKGIVVDTTKFKHRPDSNA